MTLDPLPLIASELARRLRLHQCNKIETGSWPRFAADARAHPERECPDCKVLARYKAFLEIVQVPGVPVKELK